MTFAVPAVAVAADLPAVPLSQAGPISMTTIALPAEADATVDSLSPESNQGTDLALAVHHGQPRVHTYLRFSVPALDGPIVSATLQLHPTGSSAEGLAVHPQWKPGWEEGSITDSNAPAYGRVVAASGPLSAGVVTNVDVTSVLRGAGPFNLVLTTDAPPSDAPIEISARESGDPPKLVVRTFPRALASDDFGTPNGLNNVIANEYSFGNLGDLLAARAPAWEVTSGSLFSQNGTGWTGIPDLAPPDRDSLDSTGSAVFRMRTARADFADNVQSVHAKINGFYGFPTRPAQAWDGVVLWPRYATEFNLYFAYILRKDGRVAISKKCPGGDPTGPDYYNGGTYYTTPETQFAPTVVGQWYWLATSVKDNPDGSVTVTLYRDGDIVAQATDHGAGCPPIRGPGRLGLRADNVDANFSHYAVTALP